MKRFIDDRGTLQPWVLATLTALLVLFIGSTITTNVMLTIQAGHRARQDIQAESDRKELLGIAETTQSIAQDLRSCIQPEGLCYQGQARNNRDNIERINDITAYAAYCAVSLPRPLEPHDVQSCIEELLEGDRRRE